MSRPAKRLIDNPPPGLRERAKADGSVRIWWEPPAEARAKGAKPVELDAARLTWSVRMATDLNKAAAKGPRKPTVGQTINYLIDDYQASLAFRRLKPPTQTDYRSNHRIIRAKWGTSLVADLTKPVMHTWYEALCDARSSRMALKLIRAMSILFSHSELRGWRAEGSNPCQRLKMEIPKGRRAVFDWDQMDALIAAADRIGLPNVGHAISLSMLQGQRQTDLIAAQAVNFVQVPLPPQGDDTPATVWVWRLEQSKRGNETFAVLHPETTARLAPLLAGRQNGNLLTDDRTGQPWTIGLFSKRFAEVRAAAISAGRTDLAGLQFRDLRRTFANLSRRGGATTADVADVLGNTAATNQQLGDVYMAPQILTALRAVTAVQRPRKDERKTA